MNKTEIGMGRNSTCIIMSAMLGMIASGEVASAPPYQDVEPVRFERTARVVQVTPGAQQLPSSRPAAGQTTGLPRGSIRVQRAEILDRNGFERPMVASTVFIPVGWQARGGVVWNAQTLCGPGYNVDFQANAPDGRSGLHFFPMEQWQWNEAGGALATGCPMQRILSVRQYLENLVQRVRPGARVLDYRDRRDIAAEFKQLNQVTAMPLGEIRTWVEAGEVLIGYQHNGVEMRETATSTVMFTLNRMQSMAGMPPTEYLGAGTFPGFAMRAPHGQLNLQAAEMIRTSAKANPQWTARIAQHNAKIAGINAKGARDRARITAQTGEEIRQMQADSWRLYNESSDYLSREASEAIRGVETYNDPYYGGTVQLDSSYEYAWQLNDGTYVLTNDASFEPYAATSQEGQLLEAAR